MSDREMLELAAKAAGINTLIWHDEMQSFWISYDAPQYWNPLTDDGAALRLAVKLGMQVNIANKDRRTHVKCEEWYTGPHNDDPYAATRRAIVRAAAEIGKEMK